MNKMRLSQTRIKIKSRVENLLGRQITRIENHGYSDCFDIRRSGCAVSTVFDVGSNVGWYASKYLAAFPDAKIYCFEPVGTTFQILQTNMAPHVNVECHNIALGREDGHAEIYVADTSAKSSLIEQPESLRTEPVKVRTVDTFAAENNVNRIDLLKVDTEGFDLEVLKGANEMLSSGRVAFVLAEITFDPGETTLVLFDDIRAYLLPLGFSVFGVYDQQLESTGRQRLRLANACFSREDAFVSV